MAHTSFKRFKNTSNKFVESIKLNINQNLKKILPLVFTIANRGTDYMNLLSIAYKNNE